MDLSSLKPAKGSIKKRKRIGRGEGSGRGGTSTRGHKGAQSRSGYSRKIGFEGGQMPLHRRVPKFGFRNINRKEYKAVNIAVINELALKHEVDVIDVDFLVKKGVVRKKDLVKILGDGNITKKLEVKAHAFSKSAVTAIEGAQGSAVKL